MLRRSINKKISSILVLVNLRKTACANDYFYLFYLLSYHLLASSVCSVNVSVLHLENDDKANTFHFPNDELQKTHDIPKVRAQDLSTKRLLCSASGEANVGSDFSLLRHNMCTRQILSLHKLMS